MERGQRLTFCPIRFICLYKITFLLLEVHNKYWGFIHNSSVTSNVVNSIQRFYLKVKLVFIYLRLFYIIILTLINICILSLYFMIYILFIWQYFIIWSIIVYTVQLKTKIHNTIIIIHLQLIIIFYYNCFWYIIYSLINC